MIIILTQCFPPRVGGIENLVENLSIELSKNYEVLVLADKYNKSKDALYDVNNKNNFLINRIGGLKFFRKRKKLFEYRNNNPISSSTYSIDKEHDYLFKLELYEI